MKYSDVFVMVKPDAMERHLGGRITKIFESFRFIVHSQRLSVRLTEEQAESLYIEHVGKEFFGDIVENITSGPVRLLWLKREDAVCMARSLIGATNPAIRAPETIRSMFALSFRQNSVHASDTNDAAQRELKLMFGAHDLEFGDGLWAARLGKFSGT